MNNLTLPGKFVRLEPLDLCHLDGLVSAAAADPSLYVWSFVPQGRDEMARYIEAAVGGRAAGKALPFAILRIADNAVIGSTRLSDLERLAWPVGHERHGRILPDVCEIGYTWLTRSAIRTAANTEAKLLMLTYAFEELELLRVCLHTDVRNERSRAAMERMGAKFEGVLRAYRMATDFTARDSARYSMVAAEWPEVKLRLRGFLDRK